MTLNELDEYFNSILRKENFARDSSRNGVQIQNSAPGEKQIEKVAFAVDACEKTARAAAEGGAQALVVHHGLFWGGCELISGVHYKRVAPFLQNDMALIAYHIPLDANEKVGNNYGLAARLGLRHLEPFGEWNEMSVGVKGVLRESLSIEELCAKILGEGEKPVHVLPFGKKRIETVGIISGGAGGEMHFAVEQNLDAYVTGEIGHGEYHYALESALNVIAGGHYQTETVGVNLLRAKLEKDKRVETFFIDVPTGL